MPYSVKCASFRMPAWISSIRCADALGKSQTRNGRITDSVWGPENQLVEAKKMRAAHAATGPQRASAPGLADKLVDRLGHHCERFLVELRVDEALDLVPLRRIALTGRAVGELRAGEDVEVLQHGGIAAR